MRFGILSGTAASARLWAPFTDRGVGMLAATDLTPIEIKIGGASSSALSAVILMLFLGRIAGIGGLSAGCGPPHTGRRDGIGAVHIVPA